jgi:hypothetical protein
MSNQDKAFNAYFKSKASINDLSALDIFYAGWEAGKKDSEIVVRLTMNTTEIKALVKKELKNYGL